MERLDRRRKAKLQRRGGECVQENISPLKPRHKQKSSASRCCLLYPCRLNRPTQQSRGIPLTAHRGISMLFRRWARCSTIFMRPRGRGEREVVLDPAHLKALEVFSVSSSMGGQIFYRRQRRHE